jgi:hypothetical protein
LCVPRHVIVDPQHGTPGILAGQAELGGRVVRRVADVVCEASQGAGAFGAVGSPYFDAEAGPVGAHSATSFPACSGKPGLLNKSPCKSLCVQSFDMPLPSLICAVPATILPGYNYVKPGT